jgi:hypothetical protein
MTSSLPAGDAVTTNDPADPALDEDAPTATGLEPDTAANAPGEGEASGSADVANTADRDDGRPRDPHTTLDGPALENDEIRRGTEDLLSSEEKLAEAKEYRDEVAKAGGDRGTTEG